MGGSNATNCSTPISAKACLRFGLGMNQCPLSQPNISFTDFDGT